MSQPHVQKAKKRKHAAAAADVSVAEPSTKRQKKDKSAKMDKGKARASSSEFTIINASMLVTVPPVFANDLRAGVEEMLDSMLMRYVPAFRGVVVAHENLHFLDSKATLKADCPFANCRIAFDATVWSPQVGMKLVGKISLCSPDHVSLLIHRTFNVSIPRHHLPADQWEFEYSSAENDSESRSEPAEGVDEAPAEEKEHEVESGGRWINKGTAAKLGGLAGFLQFTVVGLTVANQMLSLIGSIQSNPFSPRHQTSAAMGPPAHRPAQPADPPAPPATAQPAGESSEDEDTFGMLGRLGDEAAAREARKRDGEEMAPTKEKKRKRKEKSQAEGADAEPPQAKSKKKKS